MFCTTGIPGLTRKVKVFSVCSSHFWRKTPESSMLELPSALQGHHWAERRVLGWLQVPKGWKNDWTQHSWGSLSQNRGERYLETLASPAAQESGRNLKHLQVKIHTKPSHVACVTEYGLIHLPVKHHLLQGFCAWGLCPGTCVVARGTGQKASVSVSKGELASQRSSLR